MATRPPGVIGAAAITVVAALGLSGAAMAQSSATPLGNWARQDGLTRVNIAPCGKQICAVNTWVRDPDGSERLGDTLVMTMREDSSTQLSGKAYDERRDRTYAMDITLGPASMRTRGCVMLGLLCRSAEWTRIP